MIPRFLLSRGGVPMLQLQRLLVASPPRTSVLGIWRARISGGDNAIGRLSISPVAVRYGSSDAKDSKKAKKPKKKDSERKAKKTEEKSKKEKEKKEGEEREGGTSAANVEGSTAPDTVGGYRRALAEAVGPAAAATGVSAPEVETPKEESAPVAAEPSEPALEEVVVARADVPPSPTVAGSTAGPAAETTPAPAPEPPAGTTVPGAEGLEAAAAEPTTPGETSTRSSTAAELGELLKSESKSAEPQESKAEQESTAGDDANSHKSPEVVKVAPEDELELCPRSQEAVEKAGEPKVQPYTGPIDFYKLIASTPLPYANPHHLGRPMVASPPKGASSPPPPAPSPPPPPPPHSSPPPPLPPSSLSSSSSPPPKITEIHTSHSAPTAFPTATTAPNPQPITFASTRLNTSMASSEKSPLSSKGTVIAGVYVPSKPEEPDNCCMSGCVNCVWDLYRESLEFYTAQKLLAQQALALLLKKQPPTHTTTSTSQNHNLATTMRGDGDGVVVDESEWLDNDDIPVGIRAFMATEKMLRERRRAREEGRG